jgi:hypothetical protein
MKNYKSVISLAFLLCTIVSRSAFPATEIEKAEVFVPAHYSGKNYHITKVAHPHGRVVVSILQVKNLMQDRQQVHRPEDDWYCRAWIAIKKDGKLIDQKYFHNMEPVGPNSGIFLPEKQPSSKYFIFVTRSGYETDLYLIDEDGKVNTITAGGECFITDDLKYLFREGDEVEDGPTCVFDLTLGKTVCSQSIPTYQAYRKDGIYFYSKLALAPNGNDEVEDKTDIFYFDFKKTKFLTKRVESRYYNAAKKVKPLFTPHDYDCFCGDPVTK